jgi:hypothetical protein
MSGNYLPNVIRQFERYKKLGEGAMKQLSEDELYWQFNEASNNIAIIVKHLRGNMLSRWTDFLTSDGEKPWRTRDTEFEITKESGNVVLGVWEEGWTCLLSSIGTLSASDLERQVFIRKEPHTVIEAIDRQLAHVAYHVGQIIYIGKMLRGNAWESLSIPKGKSDEYNKQDKTGSGKT